MRLTGDEGITLLLSKLARSALDLVFPIHCAGCGREGGVICGQCADGLDKLAQPYCRVCAASGGYDVCRWCRQYPPGFDLLRSPFKFGGPVRDAIHRLKYKGERSAAGPLGALMAEHLKLRFDSRWPGSHRPGSRWPSSVDTLVPAPLHPRRLRSRGYNQSALLAREIGDRLNLPVREDLLVRVRNTRPQVETQSPQERRDNVAGSFECRADATGLNALLIDDVATTGSTLSECATALKAAGAVRVYALTLGREG